MSDVWYGFNLLYVALGLLGLSTIISNGFIIGFYQDKWKQIVPLMYNIIAICDSVTGVLTVCHACIFAFPVHSEKARYIYPVVYTILQTITRTSLFYNTMLAVVRTINITRPFYRINKRVMVCCAILYPAFLVLIFMIDAVIAPNVLIGNDNLNYFLSEVLPGFLIMYRIMYRIMPPATDYRIFLGLAVLIFGIPMILPVIISLICAVVQIHSILKPSVISPPSNRERRMTMTIIMLTLVCLICNIPITLYLFYAFYLYRRDVMGSHRAHLIYCYVLHTLLPFIQAILNPTILLQRGEALRTFVVITFRRLFNCLNSSRNTNELEMVVINNGASAMGWGEI